MRSPADTLTARFGLVLIFVALLLVLVAHRADANPTTAAPPSRYRSSALVQYDAAMQTIARWVNATGHDTVVRASIAAALGLQDADVEVRERGFRVVGERLTHVCSVSLLGGTLFMAVTDEDTGDALVWRSDSNGTVISTAAFRDGAARVVSNEAHYAQFLSEKDFFVTKLKASLDRPAGSSAHPRPPTEPMPLASRSQIKGSSPELLALFASPWVLPVVLCALAAGLYRPRRRSRDAQL